MSNEEIYVSTDVEADGPIPGPHSMLSFASAAYTADKRLIATFSANLEVLEWSSLDAAEFRSGWRLDVTGSGDRFVVELDEGAR